MPYTARSTTPFRKSDLRIKTDLRIQTDFKLNASNVPKSPQPQAIEEKEQTSNCLRACTILLFLNDLEASIWLVYLSYFLLIVMKMNKVAVASVFLASFITDGLATNLLGVLFKSDT